MAATPSAMIELGTPAPQFSLPDTVTGRMYGLDDIKAENATVVMFICNHCPYVLHIVESLSVAAAEYASKGIGFAAISSNDVENYPQDSPERMKEFAEANKFTFPYLYDESQETAKAYHAECTPDIFVYDKALKLVYRGQYDASRPGNGIEATGMDLKDALDCILSGNPVDPDQTPSIGCNIKWKK